MAASAGTLPHPILVAEIGAAHGIRGELRVKPHTADPEAIGDYGPLQDERGNRFVVKRLRPAKDMLVVVFEGITDRNAAEALTGTRLYVDRSALPAPDEDEFYHADLIGLAAVTDAGETLGEIVTVQNFGASDLLEVRRPGKGALFVPFTREVVPTVDLVARRVVVVPPPGLLDEAGAPPPDADTGA
ncbi:ribosome maturation factor RimM [Methylobrevis pamukkalensis]|uniref:Ribosome maturation factor RimM n=1 Tax=Methylobrevis pamukkalensis TaxID=1439726 RepID=A0A1E3GYQ2_9HYPH|nr:ribosome maturation factor RimM [Methylobrevis pamukkalensis]ODN69198.1 Ribosome maturation factor RimM [Methylobrevis pamukkalensis]